MEDDDDSLAGVTGLDRVLHKLLEDITVGVDILSSLYRKQYLKCKTFTGETRKSKLKSKF